METFLSSVIPAEAGTQSVQESRKPWVPAFAGMTGSEPDHV
jgi:hypothetical protein